MNFIYRKAAIMWENYGKNVNAMFDKLDKLQSNKRENKRVVELGNAYKRNSNNKFVSNKSENSLAEKVSDALQNTYGNKK